MPIQKLGPYELIEVIGRGGMGTVYKAQDIANGDIVAVKSLAPSYSLDEHFRARFESEIKALMQLNHPNIVRLISFGQDEGIMFFAMELVEGDSLYAVQKKQKTVDWREMLSMAVDICAGLKHAHDRGIIHRDLKPGNLLRDESGRVKITDFGIAKSFGASELTGEGNILGTMDFMAPEQAVGKSITAKSDLYSLGTVMYALLAGKPPFHAKTIADLATKFTTHKTERISKVVPSVPIELDRVIDNLLQKNPKNRIPTAHALTLRLQEIQEHLVNESAAATEVISNAPKTSDKNKTGANKNKTKSNSLSQPTRPSNVSQPDQLTQMDQADETSLGPDADNEELRLQTDESPENTSSQITGGPKTLANTQTDYFKQINPQVRKSKAVAETETKSGISTWILFASLLTVVVVAAFGISYAFRKPAADVLLAAIDGAESNLLSVQEEIDQMVELYPDHDRSEEMKKKDEVVDSIKYLNTTTKRAQGPRADELSQIEIQFVNAAKESNVSLPIGYAEIYLSISKLRQNPEQVTSEMATCMRHGESYLDKLVLEAKFQDSGYIDTIKEALALAKSSSSSDSEKSKAICKAVIELYQHHDWAKEQVSSARRMLKSIQ